MFSGYVAIQSQRFPLTLVFPKVFYEYGPRLYVLISNLMLKTSVPVIYKDVVFFVSNIN